MTIKRSIFGIILLLLLFAFPLTAAEILIETQPAPVYSLGDIATIKTTFKPVQATTGNFQMDLLCGGNQLNFYKNGISVPAGDEKVIESSLVLAKEIIGEALGSCIIKAYIGSDFVLTNEFLISSLITIDSNLSKTDLTPGETIMLKGTAAKENGNPSNGYIELSLIDGNVTRTSQKSTINGGSFSASVTLPKDTKSGNYILRATAYEEDVSGAVTNTGTLDNSVFVKQIPTSLEIVFEQRDNRTSTEIEPGTDIRVKAVLHDQTGVGISSETFLTIKNSNNKIIRQVEVSTDEFIEFPISYNEAPSVWKIVAVSNKLTAESDFTVLEKESADIEIENNTVVLTNTGNIPYNKIVEVKIGENPLYIDVYLKVDESKRWLLNAPDGEYDIAVTSNAGSVSGTAVLTGDAIDIRKASEGIGSLVKFPAVWIFIISVLGIMTFIVFKRGYQKAFIGYITGAPRQKKVTVDSSVDSGDFGIEPKGKAEMVLSIKGDKQEVSMITLKVKNMAWIKNVKEGGSASEIIEKIIEFAGGHRAATYDNGGNLFFIFAPARTKTFRNEPSALQAAQKIKEMLEHHNKMFKQKIDFGISLNVGEVIAKQDPDSFKFMGLGNFMNSSKKIASLAENDVFMSEKITDRLKTMVKTERHEREGTRVYSIKEIKDHEKHEQFLKGFMKRQEKS